MQPDKPRPKPGRCAGRPTLEAVIDFSDMAPDAGAVAITPLGLTAAEKADLGAFLRTLDGDPVDPALNMDTSR